MRKWTNEENGLTSRKEKNGEKRKWEKRNSEKKRKIKEIRCFFYSLTEGHKEGKKEEAPNGGQGNTKEGTRSKERKEREMKMNNNKSPKFAAGAKMECHARTSADTPTKQHPYIDPSSDRP